MNFYLKSFIINSHNTVKEVRKQLIAIIKAIKRNINEAFNKPKKTEFFTNISEFLNLIRPPIRSFVRYLFTLQSNTGSYLTPLRVIVTRNQQSYGPVQGTSPPNTAFLTIINSLYGTKRKSYNFGKKISILFSSWIGTSLTRIITYGTKNSIILPILGID